MTLSAQNALCCTVIPSFEAYCAKTNDDRPNCQRQDCSPMSLVSNEVRIVQIFAGVPEIWGVKEGCGRQSRQFSATCVVIASNSSQLW